MSDMTIEEMRAVVREVHAILQALFDVEPPSAALVIAAKAFRR